MQRIKLRTAVVGLGQMGSGIAKNLDKKGLLNAAYDADNSTLKAAGFSKTVTQLKGQNLVDQVDVILFAVPSNIEIEEALSGCVASTNTQIIDLTTSNPDDSKRLAQDLGTRGFSYIDAAMTGGAAGADAGTLTLMIGGEPEDIQACLPVLNSISDRHFHLGPVGSGHAMKLIHNLILHSSFLATCEGLSLANRVGLDVNQAVDVLNAGNARSFVTDTRFPRDILSGTMNARSVVGNLAKDLGLAVGFAGMQNGPAPYSKLTHALLSEALALGHEGTDFSHLFPLFEDIAQSKGNE